MFRASMNYEGDLLILHKYLMLYALGHVMYWCTFITYPQRSSSLDVEIGAVAPKIFPFPKWVQEAWRTRRKSTSKLKGEFRCDVRGDTSSYKGWKSIRRKSTGSRSIRGNFVTSTGTLAVHIQICQIIMSSNFTMSSIPDLRNLRNCWL